MNQELESLINITIQKGSISEKEREIILKKAEKLGEAPDEIGMIIDNKLFTKNSKTNIFASSILVTSSSSFPIPLWVGWVINSVAWILFVSTENHTIDLIMGLACCFSIYVGYQHKLMKSNPWLEKSFLSSNNLIYTSIFDGIWMFSWGLGFFGRYF